jgi:hypothetical protein
MKSFKKYISELNVPGVSKIKKGFKSRRRGKELTRDIEKTRDSYDKLKSERARGDLSQAESNPNPMRWSSESEGEISAIDKLHKLNRELRHHRSGTPLSPEQSKKISSTTPTPEDLKQLNLFSKQSGISGRNRSFTLYPNRRT